MLGFMSISRRAPIGAAFCDCRKNAQYGGGDEPEASKEKWANR